MSEHQWRDHSSTPHHHEGDSDEPIWDVPTSTTEQAMSEELRAALDDGPVGPVRFTSANCREGDHDDCLGMVEQDEAPELGITDCFCACHRRFSE